MAQSRRWIMCAALCCCISFAFAQTFTYRVEIDAPGSYQKLLQENIDITKWQGSPEMTLDFLRSVFSKTPEQIKTLMASAGYYDPQIDSSLTEVAGVWVARFAVEPGKPTHVATTDLQFVGAVTGESANSPLNVDALREKWALKQGETFRQAEWEAAKISILQPLLANRYPAARISESQALVNPEMATAKLRVVVDSGPVYSFGALQVHGLERYPATVIENLSPIAPGEPYSQDQLQELQTRLQETGYFSMVFVSANTDTATSDNRIPVKIEVVEQASKKLSFGIGFSTNTGARGKVEYQDLDIFDRSWRIGSTIEVDKTKRLISGSLRFPPRPGGAKDSITTSYQRNELQGETTRTFSLGGNRLKQEGDVSRDLALLYQREMKSIAGAEDETTKALSLNRTYTVRKTDSVLYPSRGYFFTAQVGGALEALLSDQTFFRTYAKGVWLHPMSERSTLILRGEGGVVAADSRKGIPSSFLFRTGGDDSVRGYAYQSLGVREADAIVGGRYLAVGSVEYNYWFRPKIGAAVFYDLGNAADRTKDLKPVHGFGVGGRYRSPIGPVNLDLAYGEDVKEFRLHFSLGLTF